MTRLSIRGKQVMIDRDLAELYGVKLRHYVSSQIVKTDDKEELAEIRRLLLLHIDYCDKKFSEQDEKINQIIQVLNNLIDQP